MKIQTNTAKSIEFENFELEYIDHLINTDFDLNKEKFSKSKIEKVNILIQKIKKLRLL
jgi:hypothetical protein